MTTRPFGGWPLGITLMALAAVAGAQTPPPPPLKTVTVTGIGAVLAGPGGMTLYVYANDHVGKSVCTGTCEGNWPPFRPAATDAPPQDPLSVINRLDNSKQYAYRGKPLYYCRTDKKPGEVTGHKFRDFWLAAQP